MTSALNAADFEAVLTVADVAASGRFYEALGFAAVRRHEDGGRLIGLSLRAGNAGLTLTRDNGAKGRDRVKGAGFRIWITTAQDIDALAAAVRQAGIRLEADPGPVGPSSRGFTVIDPDGFIISIARADTG